MIHDTVKISLMFLVVADKPTCSANLCAVYRCPSNSVPIKALGVMNTNVV